MRRHRELEHEGDRTAEVREQARQHAQVIHRCATKLAGAIAQLEGCKDSRRQLLESRTLGDEGDRLSRAAIAQLFADDHDPVSLVRSKDIHGQLEEAILRTGVLAA